MAHLENQTIDSIKNKYKYTIDYTHYENQPDNILYGFFGTISYSQEHYHFSEKIAMIKAELQRNVLDKSKLEEYKKEIEDLEGIITETSEKADGENNYYINTMYYLELQYKRYENDSEINDMYKKLIKGLIDESATKNIKFEKLFILYNDKLKDLLNKLNIKVNF